MSDLPAQGLFQQLNARPVSGEHLEVLGKKASALWSSGSAKTLSEAVVETVKKAGLSPEQVKRVIEFANTDAYLTEFKKEGSHRVVHFEGGPASPSDVLKDLNDGGGGSVFDRGTGDYKQPPSVKTASSDEALFEALKTASVGFPDANPYEEVMTLRDKLASSFDNLTAEISGLETLYADLADRVYSGVKQAALQGLSLGEIVQAWSTAVPSPDHIKIAFQLFTPRLLREEVFRSGEELTASIEKVGSARMVNPRHPMLTDFREYCAVLSKLASSRADREDVAEALGELTAFLKEAGLAGAIASKAREVAPRVGKAGEGVAKHLVGEDAAKLVGGALETGVKYAPHAAAAVGLNEARRQLKYSPTWNRFQSLANPYSDQYQQREYELAAKGGYA